MKNLYTLALVLLCAFVGKAQIINFPDAVFKARLLSADVTNEIASTETPVYNLNYQSLTVNSYNKIDTNNDGEIQVSEAITIRYLNVINPNASQGTIADMSGVEFFINLKYLNCSFNAITTLNLSGLSNLQGLDCSKNQLPSLDVSGLNNLQYLYCNYNQLPSLIVSGLTNLLELVCSDNQLSVLDASGLSNLQMLECINNQIQNLNLSGLNNLQYLYCNFNQLPSLNVSGMTNLLKLVCGYNQLTSLDASGLTNLQELYCSTSQLTNLNVSGSNNLLIINCGYNQLTSLDVSGLTNLQSLNCSPNQISNLNLSGLSNLKQLICSYNQLPSLNVSGLVNLQKLDCSFNQLPSIDASGLTNLKSFYCSYNQLTSLNLSGLTNLEIIECGNNQLTSLNFSGSTNLQYLDCNVNQLTSLNVSGLTLLKDLFCESNQLSSLDVSSLTNLVNLDCNSNQLESLNVNGLINLQTINCTGNQLISLFLKNGSNDTNKSFYGNPNLQYICEDENQVAVVQSQIAQYGYTNCHVNSYCTFTPGGTFFTIQGANHYDENNNGCDATDICFPNLKLAFTDGTVTGGLIPDNSGNYHYDVQTNTQTITPILENSNYFNVSPTSATVTFPTTASPFVQDFCVTANGSHPDLEVIIMPIGGARPGFDAHYKIVYKNKGNQTQSGIINLAFNDAVLDLVSANPAVTTQVLNALSWDFSNLHPFETREINFILNINSPMETPPVNSGYLLNYSATVSSSTTDETPTDNTFAFNQTVVNSLDPNEKVCLEGNTIGPEKVGDFVHYLIRFENDGTANAQNIVVKDIIDTTKFDITTLIPESGSATYTTRITNTNQVEFVFQNINLPFAAGTNTGYVAFKIKTKPTLVLGNTFSNTASIYFDYNFPIITNTATTTIQALATQDFEFNNYFTLYPNPAKNVLNISTKSTIEVHSLTIYNLLGQVILAIPNAQNLNTIDVSSLKTGHYFLKITSNKGSATEKFMKE